MAAGLGFKDFVTGEVLTAADVDGYLMQGIWVFANATARDAAVTSPQEGNFAYLKDTNTTTYYTGSAWTNLDTTGMINPMTTTGDTIYSSSGSTPARLGIGTAGQVLQVNSGATAPEWATPASGGGMTLISETVANANSSISFSGISGSYKQLLLTWQGVKHDAASNVFNLRLNNDSTSTAYDGLGAYWLGGTASATGWLEGQFAPNWQATFGNNVTGSDYRSVCSGWVTIDNYASTSKYKNVILQYKWSDGTASVFVMYATYKSTSAITSVDIVRMSGASTLTNLSNTSIRLYGIS